MPRCKRPRQLAPDDAQEAPLPCFIFRFLKRPLIVAFGTSLPELATVLLARWRGHDEIGVGTLLGSNLFNGLCIVGVAAGLHPITIAASSVLPALLLGALSVALLWPAASGWLQRWRALPLLALYLLFIVFTLAG